LTTIDIETGVAAAAAGGVPGSALHAESARHAPIDMQIEAQAEAKFEANPESTCGRAGPEAVFVRMAAG
jgi:hypothetical protein